MNVSKNLVSKHFALERPLQQYGVLGGVGIALAGLHQSWDLALALPGHFGLIWMAALVCARAGSSLRFAAIFTAIVYAGSEAAFTGGSLHTIGHGPAYLVAAFALDCAWRVSPALVRRPVFAGLVGGAAFALKPMVMAGLVTIIDLKAGALRHGLGFPLLTHFCFGATGAVIGALLWHSTHSDNTPTKA
jgi:hypothetical protein